MNGEPRETSNESRATNQTPTQEDREAERQRAQGLVAEATRELTERIAALETEVAARTQDIEALKVELRATSDELEGAKAAYAYAVEDYKQLVLEANPLFTPDIIWGTTIEELKNSMEKASLFVSKVKEGLEAQAVANAAAIVVPAGAPVLTGPNTETLSTKEKINLGLEQARRKKD